MQNTSGTGRARRLAGIAAAIILTGVGAASVVKGADGISTVRDALREEAIVGTPTMTPTAIAGELRKAGVTGVTAPECSVAGERVDDGASARCFAEYMRVDALMATQGKTYAEMPRFASKDGKGTNVAQDAAKGPDGRPLNNAARQVWVTETALATALNTSYMAEQIALFGIAVGAAFLLLAIALVALALRGARSAKA